MQSLSKHSTLWVKIGFLFLVLTMLGCGGGSESDGNKSQTNDTPEAQITVSSMNGTAPLTITFNASRSIDIDGSITSYAWSFGDGKTGNGSSISHTYDIAGTYNVVLTVTDNSGFTDKASQQILVEAPDNNTLCESMIPPEQPAAVWYEGNPYPTPPEGYSSVIGWVNATLGNGGDVGRITVHSLELWENYHGVETLLVDNIVCQLCDDDNQVFGFSLPKNQWKNASAWSKDNEATKFDISGSSVIVPVDEHPNDVYHFWNLIWPRNTTKPGATYYLTAEIEVEGDGMIQIGIDYWEYTDSGTNLQAAVSNWYCATDGMQIIQAGAYH